MLNVFSTVSTEGEYSQSVGVAVRCHAHPTLRKVIVRCHAQSYLHIRIVPGPLSCGSDHHTVFPSILSSVLFVSQVWSSLRNLN